MDRATLITIVLASVFAFVVGVATGFVTTFTHHQFAPWGLVAGLTVVVALVAGFRLVFGSRVIAGAAALGVIASTAVLALPGAGGTVLAPTDPIGFSWVFGPAVLALVVVFWPSHSRSRMEA
jgi:N-acetyl-1-D-myo-inositol-2-amino-2-deoxy-alpha-D-glucopyranoside deacetylase